MRAACVVMLLAAGLAWGDERAGELDFVWRAPPGCPDASAVLARIEQRLGAPLALRGIEIAVTAHTPAHRRDPVRFVGEIDARAVTLANGMRTLTSGRCDALADAVAVVVARLASEWRDRAMVIRDATDDDAARVQRTARRVARDAELTDVTVASARVAAVRGWGLGVHAMALSGIGTVPRVGIGGELSVFARRQDAFAEIGFARWATRSAYLVAGAPGRVEVGLDVVTLRLGWSPHRMPIRAWLGAEAGTLRGEGEALADAMAGSAPWFAVTGGFGVGWPMTRYARLVGTFQVAVPTSRVDFALAQGGDIYQSSPLTAHCALGLELGLP